MKGKAAVYGKGPGGHIEIVEFPVPEPEPGAMLLKMHMASICGSDVHRWRQELGPPPEGPWIGGHEGTGEVYKLGAEVSTDSLGQPIKEGDRLVYNYVKPCGRCYDWHFARQPIQCPNHFSSGFTHPAKPPYYFNGCFAEYFYLRPGMDVFKVPDELSDDMVAPLNCAFSQVTYGLSRVGIRFGDNVVIQGAGGLGIYATVIAKSMSANNVIIIDRLEERLNLAKRFGADYTIDMNEYKTPEERVERVKEIVGNQGADIVVEVVGRPDPVVEGIHMVRVGGKYLWIGNISAGMNLKAEIEPSDIVTWDRTIVGCVLYESWVIPRILNFLKKNLKRYPFEEVLSHRKFKLSEINEAFELSYRHEISRAAIVPD